MKYRPTFSLLLFLWSSSWVWGEPKIRLEVKPSDTPPPKKPAVEEPKKTSEDLLIRRRRRPLPKKKGIFGRKYIGFSLSLVSKGMTGYTLNEQVADKSYSGYGFGAVMDLNFTGLKKKSSIGLTTNIPWYYQFGLRLHIDYGQLAIKDESANIRDTLALIYTGFLVKYYMPMKKIRPLRKIPVINRLELFGGLGPFFNITIVNQIEDTRLFSLTELPKENDNFLALGFGFLLMITEEIWYHFDLSYMFNLTSSFHDFNGREYKALSSGSDFFLRTGLTYPIE